jgi:hypothetical protein
MSEEATNPSDKPGDDLAHLEFESLSPLEEDAANMHEIFLAFMKAGFTEDQAIKLVALMADQPDVQTVNFHFEGDLSEEIIDDLNDDE